MMRRTRAVRLFVLVCVLGVIVTLGRAIPSLAAAGDLDPTFGSGGKVTTGFTFPSSGTAATVAEQVDGRVVVAGYTLTPYAQVGNFFLARYLADGQLDVSFGEGGHVATEFAEGSSSAYAVAIQSDGKIVAAGTVNITQSSFQSKFALVRYLPDGRLDPSFGRGGRVTTSILSASNGVYALALQPDGKIVAAGVASNQLGAQGRFALARYLPDGTLDPSFGSGGMVTTAFAGNSNSIAYGLVLQPDGNLVAAGYAQIYTGNSNEFFALARYLPDGSLDAAFGGSGIVTTDFSGGSDMAYGMASQADGRVVVAGSADNDFALARYLTDVAGAPTNTPTPPLPTTTATATAGTGTPTPTPMPTVCVAGWQIVPSADDPSQFGSVLYAAAPLSPTDAWAVGYTGQAGSTNQPRPLIEHWDGTSWQVVPSPNGPANYNNYLYGVAAITSNDVWAVGGSDPYYTLIEHWDGTSWQVVPSPNRPQVNNTLKAVVALGPHDVWAVGNSDVPLAEHWDGSSWQIVPTPSIGISGDATATGITAFASNDIWMVGYRDNASANFTLHWDGSTWQVVPCPSIAGSNRLMAVSGSSPHDVWAVGYAYTQGSPAETVILHWDGQTWGRVASPNLPNTSNLLAGVIAPGASNAWAVGYADSGSLQTLIEHWDGTAWTVYPSPNQPNAWNSLAGVAAVTSTDVWAVGGTRANGDHTLTLRFFDPCPLPTDTATPPPATATATPTRPPLTATTTPIQPPSATPVPPSATPCTISLSDVTPSDYFYEPVRYLTCRGVVSGYGDGTFRPFNNTTRAQMVKIVVLGFGLPSVTPTSGYTFSDVPPSNPFFGVVETAAARGIVSGYVCGGPGEACDEQHRPYFRPNASVTRGQLSKIDVIAAGWALQNPANPAFTDVAPGSAFYQFVETAVCHAVISGYGDHTFRPGANATRGQITKIVYLSITDTGGCSP